MITDTFIVLRHFFMTDGLTVRNPDLYQYMHIVQGIYYCSASSAGLSNHS